MFVGRSYEIDQLNKLYNRPGFQLAVLYGRRKVGKTSLVKEFCKNKPTLFYIPEEHDDNLAFNSFRNSIFKHFKLSGDKVEINTWEDAFRMICKESNGNRMLLVLDAFPSLTNENPSISSIINKVIETQMKATEIFLIIIGSFNGLTERHVINSKSGLFAFRSAQFKLEPLSFFESTQFFPNIPIYDKVKFYSTLGGMPHYLAQFDYNRSYDENVIELLLNKSSYLFGEPESYLKSKLESLSTADKVLSLLSKGDYNLERFNETNFFMGKDLIFVIKKLKELGVIKRHKSIGVSEKRPWSYYRLEDHFFRYWYRFLYKNRNLVEMGMQQYLYQNKIAGDINSHIGYVFEDICTQFLKKLNSSFQLPFVFESIGSWIGYNLSLKKPSQLDIVASSENNVLVGECKWTGSPINMNIIQSLIKKSHTLRYDNKYYCFFSKSGYNDEAKEYSLQNENIYLFSLKDIEKLL